jgi:hypothetical protein
LFIINSDTRVLVGLDRAYRIRTPTGAAMLSGQLALRPCSLCHLSLYFVSTAFLLWQEKGAYFFI